MELYNLKYDHASKIALLDALSKEREYYQNKFLETSAEEDALKHEQMIRIIQGVLYSKAIKEEETPAPSLNIQDISN